MEIPDDGSLTLTIGHGEPEDKSNWLLAPEGSFYLGLRLYVAKPEVLADKWTSPSVVKVN